MQMVAYAHNTMKNAKPKFRDEAKWQQEELEFRAQIFNLQKQIASMQVHHAKEIQKRDAQIIAYRRFFVGERSGITYAQLEFRICRLFKISKVDMRGSARTQHIAAARQCLMYWARRLLGMSYPRIGQMMNRDHTTVIHGVRKWPMVRADMGRHLRVLEELPLS